MEFFFSAKTNFSLNFKEVKPIFQTPKTEGDKGEILQQKLGLRGETTLAKAWTTNFLLPFNPRESATKITFGTLNGDYNRNCNFYY